MKTIIPLAILPIEDDGFHLLLTIKINGKDANLILDTGASKSVFDENRIVNFLGHNNLEDQERLSTGLGTTTMTSKTVMVDKLQFNKLIITNYKATILDLQHVNQSYEKLGIDLIDGILGGDILLDYSATIDYKKKQLTLAIKN